MTTEMAHRLAEACTHSSQAKKLYKQTPYGDKDIEQIYLARWQQLADKEAPAIARACKSAWEARDLYHRATEDTTAKAIYSALWVRLANAEAPLKAKEHRKIHEVESLYQDAPDKSLAQEIYLARLLELKLSALEEARRLSQTLSLVKGGISPTTNFISSRRY